MPSTVAKLTLFSLPFPSLLPPPGLHSESRPSDSAVGLAYLNGLAREYAETMFPDANVRSSLDTFLLWTVSDMGLSMLAKSLQMESWMPKRHYSLRSGKATTHDLAAKMLSLLAYTKSEACSPAFRADLGAWTLAAIAHYDREFSCSRPIPLPIEKIPIKSPSKKSPSKPRPPVAVTTAARKVTDGTDCPDELRPESWSPPLSYRTISPSPPPPFSRRASLTWSIRPAHDSSEQSSVPARVFISPSLSTKESTKLGITLLFEPFSVPFPLPLPQPGFSKDVVIAFKAFGKAYMDKVLWEYREREVELDLGLTKDERVPYWFKYWAMTDAGGAMLALSVNMQRWAFKPPNDDPPAHSLAGLGEEFHGLIGFLARQEDDAKLPVCVVDWLMHAILYFDEQLRLLFCPYVNVKRAGFPSTGDRMRAKFYHLRDIPTETSISLKPENGHEDNSDQDDVSSSEQDETSSEDFCEMAEAKKRCKVLRDTDWIAEVLENATLALGKLDLERT